MHSVGLVREKKPNLKIDHWKTNIKNIQYSQILAPEDSLLRMGLNVA